MVRSVLLPGRLECINRLPVTVSDLLAPADERTCGGHVAIIQIHYKTEQLVWQSNHQSN